MTDINKYHTAPTSGIMTDEILIELVRAFERVSPHHLCVFDYKKRDFLYVADNGGIISEENIKIAADSYCRGLDFIRRQPTKRRKDYTVACCQHSHPRKGSLLLNHRLTPLIFSGKNDFRFALCVVSLAPLSESEKLTVIDHKTNRCFHYSSTQKRWIVEKVITLSAIEKEMLSLAAQGHTISEIANITCRSVDSVKSYKRGVFKKIGAHKITEAITYAQNHDLL